MRRIAGATWLTLTLTLVLTACENGTRLPSAPVTTPVRIEPANDAAVVPGTCTTKSALTSLINTVFGAGSPNARSALGKLDNLDRHVRKGNFAEARAQAFNLVDFVLAKHKQGGLPGTFEQVGQLASLVFCYAGLDFTVDDPTSATIVYPNEQEQVVTASDQQAGVQLPPNIVGEPTLIEVTPIPPFPVPGAGPLFTRLDQYSGYYHFEQSSHSGGGLAQPVVVGVCAAPGISADVFARLRLGHQASGGFEITPPADVSFLNCPTETSSSGLSGLARRVASFLLPKNLYAAAMIGGGVGGLASEFSDFGPVDVGLFVGGGVGGLPSEFLRAEGALSSECSEGVEAPIGTPVAVACRPQVTISTHLGTLLAGVPVTFTVESGGGTIAPEIDGTCGTFGLSATVPTTSTGVARICWTLGASAGANSVRAAPAVGGDAPGGVSFTPSAFLFSATANPPEAVRFDTQPAEGQNIPAGAPIPLTISVVDRNGDVVEGWSGSAFIRLNQGWFAGRGAIVQTFITRGTFTFIGLSIDQVAPGYRITATAYLDGGAVVRDGNTFNVVAP